MDKKAEQMPEDLFETGMLHNAEETEDELLVDGAADESVETDEDGEL